jgi:hypothetical protein
MSDGQVELALEQLLKRMHEHKEGALNRSDGTEFQFGHACGVAQGHAEAKAIFEQVLAAGEPDQGKHYETLL